MSTPPAQSCVPIFADLADMQTLLAAMESADLAPWQELIAMRIYLEAGLSHALATLRAWGGKG